jgi:hypothetical protein
VLDRLSDVQVEALRSAVPLLAAPVTAELIDAVATPVVETAMASMAYAVSGSRG